MHARAHVHNAPHHHSIQCQFIYTVYTYLVRPNTRRRCRRHSFPNTPLRVPPTIHTYKWNFFTKWFMCHVRFINRQPRNIRMFEGQATCKNDSNNYIHYSPAAPASPPTEKEYKKESHCVSSSIVLIPAPFPLIHIQRRSACDACYLCRHRFVPSPSNNVAVVVVQNTHYHFS